MTATAGIVTAKSLLLPAFLLCGLLALLATQSGAVRVPASGGAAPATVVVASRPFVYRASGDYIRDGYPEDAPLVSVADPAPLEIMTFEVSAADYARCVADSACRATEAKHPGVGAVPITGVSFEDADDYAHWLSRATGATWRLPTVEEWVFAAGSQAVDPALLAEVDVNNPAERWLALYDKESALGVGVRSVPGPAGSFGINELGVADIGGPVWEWTSSCATRTVTDARGAVLSRIDSCGVRYLEGRHRTAMSLFIRDGKTGGCSVGAPPDNLGFRLVREPPWYELLLRIVFGRH